MASGIVQLVCHCERAVSEEHKGGRDQRFGLFYYSLQLVYVHSDLCLMTTLPIDEAILLFYFCRLLSKSTIVSI